MSTATTAELTDLHSESAQVLSIREMYTLTDKKPDTRQREECGPNLLKINAPRYQHLVWHVLVISFSPVSLY